MRALLRGPAGAAGRAQLEQVLRAARRGEPVAESVAALLAEIPGDPAGPPRDALPPRLPHVALPPPAGGYICPADACSRAELRQAGSPAPHCDIHQQSLRFHPDAEPTR
jgi:hypothetical protein